MNASLQRVALPPWQHQQHLGPLSGYRFFPSQECRLAFSSSLRVPLPLYVLPRTHLCIHRSASVGPSGVDPAQQAKPVDPMEGTGMDADQDPYSGWYFSDESPQASNSKFSGWAKIGGTALLTIGFAVGACFIYTQSKEASRRLPVPPPRKERCVSSVTPADLNQSSGTSENKSDNIPESQYSVPEASVKQENYQKTALSAASHKVLGRIVVPAAVDHAQEQVLAALQALKVIEAGIQPGDICTRREYARWLIATSATLSRSSAHKVFPAMCIEDVTKLAFDDVLPDDPDFPFIQGLAEAGLISSKLLADDEGGEQGMLDENDNCRFFPDSPLTRQDLVAWKVAFDRKFTPPAEVPGKADEEAILAISGFIDIHKIDRDAWPAIFADLSAGERSIICLAFGYTRRFQPEKPVTKAQAATALAIGEAWELVSEELLRLEAEALADAAVVAELALETRAQQEVAAALNELLHVEREKGETIAKMLEKACFDLEKVNAEWEEEKMSLQRERLGLELDKKFVSKLRHDVEELALGLSNAKFEVRLDKEQAEKLHAAVEEERRTIYKVRSELDVEKKALLLARTRAEAEARRAFAHAKVLEQARKRWEYQGVQVHVDKDLDESNIPGPSWHYSNGFQTQQSPMKSLLSRCSSLGKVILDVWMRFVGLIHLMFHAMRQQTSVLVKRLVEKCDVASKGFTSVTSKAMECIPQTVPSAIVGVASGLREGTVKTVGEWKGGAERLSQKLKQS